MKKLIIILLVLSTLSLIAGESELSDLYKFEVETISGEILTLEKYRDKVILIVNVASKCGFTPQYDGLEKIYQKYRDRGLVILGFPANDFMNQEPGSNEEILNFCRLNYGVTFPLFSKISVKGKNIHPLYQYLTDKKQNPEFGGKITWNFNKFLISKDGRIVNRFGSKVKPESSKIVSALEAELGA